MRAYEVVIRGSSDTGLIVNSHWYHQTTPDVPNEASLADFADIWQRDMQPKLLAAHSTHYFLREVAFYGWDPVTWVRTPFLPVIRAVGSFGTKTVTGQNNAYSCAIFSMKVEPQQPSKQRDPETGAIVDKPVRRGYLAHGPLNEQWLEPNGFLLASMPTDTQWVAYRDQLKTDLVDAVKLANPATPIRVGKPAKGQTQKGWGYVRDVVIRSEIRVRRSRLVGMGA